MCRKYMSIFFIQNMQYTFHYIPEGVRYMDKSLDFVFLASSALITLAKMLSLGPEKFIQN